MSKTCSVEVCDRPAKSKGLCGGHYERLRLTGELRPDEPLGWKPERPTVCSVEGCVRDVRSKGSTLCDAHYMRQRLTGDLRADVPIGGRPLPDVRFCSAKGCPNLARSRTNQWCEAHYYRLRRTGSPQEDVPLGARSHEVQICEIEGCGATADARGLCTKHLTRLRRHGDPLRVIPPSGRALRAGPDHHAWTEDPTYVAVHIRVRKAKGKASAHLCIDCGEPARHWSYSGPEYVAPLPFNADLDLYLPRCVPCHSAHDKARRAKRAG